MRRGSGRRVVLGLRWDGPSWDQVPVWCDAVLPLIEGVPVQWCFPALPPDYRIWADESFIKPVRSRLSSTGDGILPTGFSGAPHPLLTLDELEKELAWSSKNPWSTGITDVFGVKAAFFAPKVPDLDRPGAVDAYRAAGFSWMGIAGDSLPVSFRGMTLQPYRRIVFTDTPASAAVRGIRQAVAHGRNPFFLVELSTFPSTPSIASFVEELLKQLSSLGAEIAGLDSIRSAGSPPAAAHAPSCRWDSMPAHLIREKLDSSSSYQKKKRKKNDDYKKILSLIASASSPDDASQEADEPAGKAGRDTTLVAHMQGDVALAGESFDVRLTGGRFCGIERRGRHMVPAIVASSHITISGRTYAFKSKSAISFEGNDGTGLRDELVAEIERDRAEKEAALLTVEYEFKDNLPELFISAEIRYPLLSREQIVEGAAPLLLSLLELEGGVPASLEVTYPDGSMARHQFTEKDGWKPVPGMRWTLEGRWGKIHLQTAFPVEKRWGLCFFRVTRKKGRRILESNPFGSSIPVAGSIVSGRKETHTILIGLEAEGGRNS
jgi:hypothetical protein